QIPRTGALLRAAALPVETHPRAALAGHMGLLPPPWNGRDDGLRFLWRDGTGAPRDGAFLSCPSLSCRSRMARQRAAVTVGLHGPDAPGSDRCEIRACSHAPA